MKRNPFQNQLEATLMLICFLLPCSKGYTQNSMVGDGFGGRSWYIPYNYNVGSYHANTVCGSNNQLYSWGGNNTGQQANFGNSTTAPIAIPGMTNVKFTAAGYLCAVLKYDNTAWVWPTSALQRTPVQRLTNVKFIDAGTDHVVYVRNDGTVWGSGKNQYGQLGNNTVTAFEEDPVQMHGINNAVRAIAVGYPSNFSNNTGRIATVILLSDGTLKITGGYPNFTLDSSIVPIPIPGLTDIVDIKGNSRAVYALNSSGEVYSFGSTRALGLGSDSLTYTSPHKINFPAGAAPIIAISSTDDGLQGLALDENKNVYGWGHNANGELGCGNQQHQLVPVLCATDAVDILTGEGFSYIVKSDRSLWVTGWSFAGSVMMDMPKVLYTSYVEIHPQVSPMFLCAPVPSAGAVPIRLQSFNCTERDNKALLNWRSASEVNANKYIIEYSESGNEFKQVGSVTASGENTEYHFQHNPDFGRAFYRLRMVDKDGKFSYSNICSLTFTKESELVLTPNPAYDFIKISNAGGEIKRLEIISTNGSLIKTVNGFNNRLKVRDLIPGVYFLKIIYFDEHVKFQKFVKR